MFKPQHTGVTFSEMHIQQARTNRGKTPFDSAWQMLEHIQPNNALEAAQIGGLRFRFNSDQRAGEEAIDALFDQFNADTSDSLGYLEALAETVTLAQSFEMLRTHPAFAPGKQAQWLDQFWERVSTLNQSQYGLERYEEIWQGLGVELFQQVIREEIHPEGYLHKAVSVKDGHSFYRQLLSVKALALMAEAATHAGIDLWRYAFRGVSVMTAAAYVTFYYYYPEKWQWDEENFGDGESITSLFKQHSGFIEMVNRHESIKATRLLLDDLRPIYDPYGGGLTTLTHGVVVKRGLFG
jgi:hypothetical protein